jgi:hypothetical protein
MFKITPSFNKYFKTHLFPKGVSWVLCEMNGDDILIYETITGGWITISKILIFHQMGYYYDEKVR